MTKYGACGGGFASALSKVALAVVFLLMVNLAQASPNEAQPDLGWQPFNLSQLENANSYQPFSHPSTTDLREINGDLDGLYVLDDDDGGLLESDGDDNNDVIWSNKTMHRGMRDGSLVSDGLTITELIRVAKKSSNSSRQVTPCVRVSIDNPIRNTITFPSGAIRSSILPLLYRLTLNINQRHAVQNNMHGQYLLANHLDASGTAV